MNHTRHFFQKMGTSVVELPNQYSYIGKDVRKVTTYRCSCGAEDNIFRTMDHLDLVLDSYSTAAEGGESRYER